jgi:hypothetical protein
MIKLTSFAAVEIDGVNVGDCLSAVKNYPGKAGEIMTALVQYETALIAAAQAAQAVPPAVTLIDDTRIKQLEEQLAQFVITDWSKLVTQLKAAGFYEWTADAIQFNADLQDAVSEMREAAQDKNLSAVVSNYLVVATAFPPSAEQVNAWQTVLDNFEPHPIPRNLITFVPQEAQP